MCLAYNIGQNKIRQLSYLTTKLMNKTKFIMLFCFIFSLKVFFVSLNERNILILINFFINPILSMVSYPFLINWEKYSNFYLFIFNFTLDSFL